MSGQSVKSSEKNKDELAPLFWRSVIFGLVVAMLTVISGLFVFGIISQPSFNSNVELSARGAYTIKLVEVSRNERHYLEQLLENEDLKKLLDVNELFITQAGPDRFALCAGRFDSRKAEEAKRVMSRLGHLEFGEEAELWFAGPPKN